MLERLPLVGHDRVLDALCSNLAAVLRPGGRLVGLEVLVRLGVERLAPGEDLTQLVERPRMPLDRAMVVTDVRLEEKSGGRTGDYVREA